MALMSDPFSLPFEVMKMQSIKETIYDDCEFLIEMLQRVDYTDNAQTEQSAPYVIGYVKSALQNIQANVQQLEAN